MTRELLPNHKVFACRNANEAITRSKKRGCDLLLTEIEIGRTDLDGLLLAEMLRERNPRLEVICVTDCRNAMTAFRAWEIAAKGYITKPCAPETLAKAFANLRGPMSPHPGISAHPTT